MVGLSSINIDPVRNLEIPCFVRIDGPYLMANAFWFWRKPIF